MKRRRTLGLAAGLVALAAMAGPVAAGGPPHTAFYVDGQLYATVGTPSNFFDTGAPESTYDNLYAIPGQPAVAASAPGDTDYNGGRWLRFQTTWNVTPYTLYSEEDVLDAYAAGDLSINWTPDASFLCPVIPIN
jgi:hypothetical protein